MWQIFEAPMQLWQMYHFNFGDCCDNYKGGRCLAIVMKYAGRCCAKMFWSVKLLHHITSCDQILVEKSVMHVNQMILFGRNLAHGSHMTPLGKKEYQALLLFMQLLCHSITPIISHRQFLLNTKMAIVVLNLSISH